MIDGKLVGNLSDLAALGAILPEEVSRIIAAADNAPE